MLCVLYLVYVIVITHSVFVAFRNSFDIINHANNKKLIFIFLLNTISGSMQSNDCIQWCGNSQSYRTLSDKSSECSVKWN